MTKVDAELGRLLQRTMGLNPNAVSAGPLEEAVSQRMAEHGIRGRAKYLAILRCSRQERLSLVESVELPAAVFFQHPEPLIALQRWVTNHWLARPSKKPLRVLSVPCATGEEPYSLAISLLESGLQSTQFHIDAADINNCSLRRAAAAVYPERSLTATTLAVRERYFQRESDGHRLCQSVRTQVSFLKADLLGRLTLTENYDIIFGRSLMIYFEARVQHQILKRLERLLLPGGLLIVGPSQARRGSNGGALTLPSWTEDLNGARLPSALSGLGRKANDAKRITVEERAHLREAASLLESHRLQEAASLCLRVLEEHRASAQAVFLLGRIAEAEGRRAEAREFFRRALYLQPRHRQAKERLGC